VSLSPACALDRRRIKSPHFSAATSHNNLIRHLPLTTCRPTRRPANVVIRGVWAAAFGESVLAIDEGDAFYICGDSSFALVLVVALGCGIPFVVFSSGLVRASPRGNWWRSWQCHEATFGDRARDGSGDSDVFVAFKNLELLLKGHVLIALVGEYRINGLRIRCYPS
jgi:hypothetical protein